MDEIHHAHEPPGEQVDVEAKTPRELIDGVLLRRQQVEEQGGLPRFLERLGDEPIAGTEAAAAAAVREKDDPLRPVGDG